MVLRAGEVLEQTAEVLRRHDPQVDPEPLLRDDGRLRVALRGDLEHPRQADEVVDQRAGLRRGGDHVEVAERLASAARAAGLGDLDRGRMLPQRRDDLADDGQADAEQPAALRLGPEALRERLEDPLLALRAEPLERPDPLLPPRPARRPSSVVTPSSRQIRAAVFGPRPGRRRNCRPPAGTSARRFSSADIDPVSASSTTFASIVAPIPGSSFAVPGERQLRDRRGRVADARRRPPVGEHAEALLAQDLGDVRQLVQRVRDVRVARQRGHPPIIGLFAKRRLPPRRSTSCAASAGLQRADSAP